MGAHGPGEDGASWAPGREASRTRAWALPKGSASGTPQAPRRWSPSGTRSGPPPSRQGEAGRSAIRARPRGWGCERNPAPRPRRVGGDVGALRPCQNGAETPRAAQGAAHSPALRAPHFCACQHTATERPRTPQLCPQGLGHLFRADHQPKFAPTSARLSRTLRAPFSAGSQIKGNLLLQLWTPAGPSLGELTFEHLCRSATKGFFALKEGCQAQTWVPGTLSSSPWDPGLGASPLAQAPGLLLKGRGLLSSLAEGPHSILPPSSRQP